MVNALRVALTVLGCCIAMTESKAEQGNQERSLALKTTEEGLIFCLEHGCGWDWDLVADAVSRGGGNMIRASVGLPCQQGRWLTLFPSKHLPMAPAAKGIDQTQAAVDALKKKGIKLMVYNNMSNGTLCSQMYKLHPDWGKVYPKGADKGGNVPSPNTLCFNNPVARAAYVGACKELVGKYDVAGMYFDGPRFGDGRYCVCDHCQNVSRKLFNKPMPTEKSNLPADPQWRFMQLKVQWQGTETFAREIHDGIKSVKSSVAVLFNLNDAFSHYGHAAAMGKSDGCLGAEHRSGNRRSGILSGVMKVKAARAFGGASWGYTPPGRGSALTVSMYTRLWAMHGGTPLMRPLNQWLNRNQMLDSMSKEFGFLTKHRKVFYEYRSTPHIAVYASFQNLMVREAYHGKSKLAGKLKVSSQDKGPFSLLTDGHQVYGVVLDTHITQDGLRPHKALYLPNIESLSDQQVKVIKEFVKNGGGLLATGRTSMRDEHGKERADFALAELFQASYQGERQAKSITISEGDPITRTVPSEKVIACEGTHISCKPLSKGKTLGQSNADGAKDSANSSAIIASEYGKGRVVYVGAPLEEVYAETGDTAIRQLMNNAINWVANSDPIVKISNAPTSLICNLTEKGDHRALHLLNYTETAETSSKELSGHPNSIGNIQSIASLENLKISIQSPSGKTPVSVRSTETGELVEFQKEEGGLSCLLKKLGLYECLLIEYRSEATDDTVGQLIKETDFGGGLLVHLGCGDGQETVRWGVAPEFLVHALDSREENISAARNRIKLAGKSETIFADWLGTKELPYCDNLVNIIVAKAEEIKRLGISEEEILRVLVPQGVALLQTGDKWKRLVKPRPKNIDEWQHFRHSPTDDGVSRDTVAGIPHGVQWIAGPRYVRQHNSHPSFTAMMSAGGRLFYVVDEGPISLMDYPPKWFLMARDAFNGQVLWKKKLDHWLPTGRSFKGGIHLFNYRVAATAERLFVTLGLSAPVSELDPKTGEIVKVYQGSEHAVKFFVVGSTLLVITSDYGAEKETAQAIRRGEDFISLYNKKILAYDIATGNCLWKQEGDEIKPLVLSAISIAGDRLYCLFDKRIAAFDLATGKQTWSIVHGMDLRAQWKRVIPRITASAENNVLVLFTPRELQAFSLDDGKKVWNVVAGSGKTKHPRFYYQSPGNIMFIVDDKIWVGAYPPIVLDAKTGKELAVLPKEVQPSGHHPRCYPAKATRRYLMTAARGIEFYDMTGKENHEGVPWVRGTCNYGVLPANGLLYAPPSYCTCYMDAKLSNLNALSPLSASVIATEPSNVLRKGPAYGRIPKTQKADSAGWPTFRQGSQRKGFLNEEVPHDLKPRWRTPVLDKKITPPVIDRDSVVFAEEESGLIHAVDRESGEPKWQYQTHSRIVTAPTLHKGWVLCGARNGSVYCIDSTSGQLAWRRRIAPKEHKMLSYGKLESLWPVFGSVLVWNDTLYASAGTSSYLNGGMFLYAIDIPTGAIKQTHRMNAPRDHATHHAFSTAGTSNDVMKSDGKNVIVARFGFTPELKPTEDTGQFVYSNAGLYDDQWFNRGFWSYGHRITKANRENFHDYRSKMEAPGGFVLAIDDDQVYGIETQVAANGKGSKPGQNYNSVLIAEKVKETEFGKTEDFTYNPGERNQFTRNLTWTIEEIPFQARGLAASRGKLFLTGWNEEPIPADERDDAASSEEESDKTEEKSLPDEKIWDLFQLRKAEGGSFWVCDKKDGSALAKYTLPSGAIFDGVALAHESVFIALEDGSVACYHRSAE